MNKYSQLSGTLDQAVTESCETGSEEPLLKEILDPSLVLLRDNLDKSNFERFLWKLWEAIIITFQNLVNRNADVS